MLENTKEMTSIKAIDSDAGVVSNRCYTVQDIQTMLGIGRKGVYALLKRNEFRWIKVGNGGYRIPRKSFDEWLERVP